MNVQEAAFEKETTKLAVAAHAEDFARWMFPAGRRIGSEWRVGDLSGNRGKSLVVPLVGDFAGTYRDWATHEHGDCIKLVRARLGLDFVAALRVLRERYGIPVAPLPSSPTTRANKAKRLRLPLLECGTRKDISALATGRSLGREALEIASSRGVLWFCDTMEGRAWVITDRARRNAQARRLDGRPWEWNRKKAWTIRNSRAKCPIGLPESEPFAAIAVCEGGPDFLAAFHHAFASGVELQVAPVCMAGAGLDIEAECLPAFAEKRIRIFVHADSEGRTAGERWAVQLCSVGAHVDGFDFDGLTRNDGEPVSDLCDLASVSYDSWEEQHEAVEGCMGFVVESGGA